MPLAGVSGDQQALTGRWVTSRRLGNYTAALSVEALKALADFKPNSDYDYFLRRAEVLSPRELQLVVFPKVDYCIESSNNMDNVEEDKSDPFVLNLLQELRTVFLQANEQYNIKLLQPICNHSVPFHTSQMVQMALSEMTAAIQSGLGSMSVQIKANCEDLKAYHKVQMDRVTALEHRIGQFFVLDNAQFNQVSPIPLLPFAFFSPSPPPLLISSPLPAQNMPRSSSSSMPSYTLGRAIQTVTDLWR
ncbi:hypothetical protein K501DRAFT_308407 [Backusella circina FSU 941]|nr:hypothetical protein K501DRAFT_308407 [Backusella circina FSU 941]